MTTHYKSYEAAAKAIIDYVGKKIVIGIPLGLGKPVGLINALYQLVSCDKSLNLTIVTALTLAKPTLSNELEKRFVAPILERLLGDYEDPLYEKARELQQLPENINVIEFFLATGKYLHNQYVQQNYISSAYTSVIHDAIYYGINVLAQQVVRSSTNKEEYSLSCNSDLFSAMAEHLDVMKRSGKHVAIVAEVNANLPFMYGVNAVIPANEFTDIVDTGKYKSLFALPRDEISPQDHLIGIYTSSLIKDDSCLQIGIGALSNAVASALILRHNENSVYRDLLKELKIIDKFRDPIATIGEVTPFKSGLYASTEMLSDEYMQLYKSGILQKRVYDDVILQRLLNDKVLTEDVTPEMIDHLLDKHRINLLLTAEDVDFLKKFGIFKEDVFYNNGYLTLPTGAKIKADLTGKHKYEILRQCLGTQLKSGKIIHAGFFIGSNEFYDTLRQLPLPELQQIEMTTIARTNELSWAPELLTLQRQHMRFVNTAMMVTLGGGLISDGLKNLQEVSGIGGQFDFVLMAQKLKNSRSIINCRSTRTTKQGTFSNIIWDYPNLTLARFLRDIVITEYGIADCRCKSDTEIIKSILNITDSRYQETLLQSAIAAGKLAKNYEIPKLFQNNLPSTILPIMKEFRQKGYCKPYPFGSDFSPDEIVLQKALLFLKNCSQTRLLYLTILSMLYFRSDDMFVTYLKRMNLVRPQSVKEFVYKKLLKFVIGRSDKLMD
ncbi:MAG: acetyl-CoA hydrolase/transferase C-terminal domain-containing protein [Gammaproteobacteria bacterium]